MAENKKTQTEKKEGIKVVKSELPAPTRGRVFEGFVIKKFPTRAVIEFERIVKSRKYERFFKKRTRIHARIPQGINIQLGDHVKAQECRPLSKITHFIVIEKIHSSDSVQRSQKTKEAKA